MAAPARQGRLALPAAELLFVPVIGATDASPAAISAATAGLVEVVLGGALVRVPHEPASGAYLDSLPREEVVIKPDDQTCPCGGGAMHRIGEDIAERLEVIPAQFRVIVTRRPKYGCRACESAVIQAPAPARPVEGGLPSKRGWAHIGRQVRRPPAALRILVLVRRRPDRAIEQPWAGVLQADALWRLPCALRGRSPAANATSTALAFASFRALLIPRGFQGRGGRVGPDMGKPRNLLRLRGFFGCGGRI
jgi:hypothetical protein